MFLSFSFMLRLVMPLYMFLGFEVISDEWNSIVVTKASTDTLITVNCTASETKMLLSCPSTELLLSNESYKMPRSYFAQVSGLI